MNIEIPNEQITEIVETEARKLVTDWFKKQESKCLIREAVNKEIVKLVTSEIHNANIDICQLVKELTSEELMRRVANQISGDIASAYADKFSY